MGIRAAAGEYIVHHNADNILYPNALQEVHRLTIPENYPCAHLEDGTTWEVHPHIIIFPIYQIGCICTGRFLTRFVPPKHDQRILLTGFPAHTSFIDALQLVMSRQKWLLYNEWYKSTKTSDGIMYQRFIADNGARYTATVLGEHW